MGLCLVYLSPLLRILEIIIINPARIDRVEKSKLCVRLVSSEMTTSFPGFSPTRPMERERQMSLSLHGAGRREPWERGC